MIHIIFLPSGGQESVHQGALENPLSEQITDKCDYHAEDGATHGEAQRYGGDARAFCFHNQDYAGRGVIRYGAWVGFSIPATGVIDDPSFEV
jgi:hypothetical protein